MGVWFTSDLHIGHRAVAYTRRYGAWPEDRSLVTPEDVEWHDALLAGCWDSVVKPDDVVWGLGDLIANPKSLPAALEWIKARPGRKHWVLGNHDPAHPMHSESHKWENQYRDAFESVGIVRKRYVPLPDGGRQSVLLSHFPYRGDSDGKEDRCTQWRLPNEGLPVLHGHVHSKEKVIGAIYSPTPGKIDRALQIHVGVDAWDFGPVSLEEVGELLV